jgi:hypothetical protein
MHLAGMQLAMAHGHSFGQQLGFGKGSPPFFSDFFSVSEKTKAQTMRITITFTTGGEMGNK